MSWTMYETESGDNVDGIRLLKKSIEDAANEDILLYCACEDQGQVGRGEKPYPANCGTNKIKRVGAAGAYGEISKRVDSNEVDYLFPGEIALKKEICTGSSAATALAAGLAAMI